MTAEQTEQLAAQYRSGLRLLDAGQWQQAIETLERLVFATAPPQATE